MSERSRRPPGIETTLRAVSVPPPPEQAIVVDLDSFRVGYDPVFVFDVDTLALLHTNERARDLLGIDESQQSDHTIDVLVGEGAPFDGETLLDEFMRSTKVGSHRFSWRTVDAQRSQIFLELTIRIAQIGGAARFLVVAQDQTEKIALLEALERTTAVLRNAVSRSPVAIVLFDAPDGRIRLSNRAAEQLRADAGRFSTNAIEAFCFAERDGLALSVEQHPFRRVLEHGASLENEQLAAIVGGRRRSVLVHAAPILSTSGEIISAVAIIPDVTDVVRAETALRERDRFLRRFYEQTREVIFNVDHEGTIVSVSPSVRDVLGFAPSELVGRKIGESIIVSASETDRSVTGLAHILRGGYLEPTDHIYFTKDGGRIVGEVTGSPIEDRDGQPSAIFVVRDVTERRLADERRAMMETTLRKRQRLETVGSLASGVAHEINNPLTGILNLAEMLELDIVPASDVGKTGSRIRALCERMATIVAELMSLAASEPDDFTDVDVIVLVQSALDLLRPQIRRARIVADVFASEPVMRIRGRGQPLVQALLNLLGNACEALADLDPEIARTLRVDLASGSTDGSAFVRVSITDSGRGVDPSIRNSLFEPFVSSKDPSTGAGLGLWVSRGIVAEHGGRIWYEDVAPHGASFHLELPVAPPTDSQKHGAP